MDFTETHPRSASPTAAPGDGSASAGGDGSSEAARLVDLVEACRAALERGVGAGADAAELVDLVSALEGLKSSACAVQGEAAVRLDDLERDRQAHAGVPARRRGAGVAAQVALARRESPHRGMVLLGAARVWSREMPHTFAALRAGRLSEHRAVLLVAETACLELEDRREIDAALCADPGTLAGLGTAAMVALVRRHAARLDPAAVVRRARRAASERRVTLRPAPDSMAYLTTLLPVEQGVAAYAALCQAADSAAVTNDGAGVTNTGAGAARVEGAGAARVEDQAPRSRGQVMADTLVERVTGQASASAVPVTVDLVISDATLLGAGHEAAHLLGGGPVPAQVARELVAAGLDAGAAWLRRLYADPGGRLVAMSSRSRFHPEGLADFLRIRDQGICRTPYCDAPIRQIDHVVPAAADGETSAANGAGLCVACNLAKEAPGWRRHTLAGTPLHDRASGNKVAPGNGAAPGTTSVGHVVRVVTPTGHEYDGRAPSAPAPAGRAPTLEPAASSSALDQHFLVDQDALIEMMFDDLAARCSLRAA